MQQQQQEQQETSSTTEDINNSFHQTISWNDFREFMRPPPPLTPRSFADLDLLQPKYPLPPPQTQKEACQMLNAPYRDLTCDEINMFRCQRWIRLKSVLPAPLLIAARARIVKLATAATNGRNISLPDDSIYSDGFFSEDPEKYWELISEPATQSWNIQMMWAVDPLVRALVCNPRIGDIVCALLGCDGVRLYHDNCLSRAPGSKHTRWHCDDGPGEYMAMKPCEHLGQQAVTVWYPLQSGTSPEKGSLIFASLPETLLSLQAGDYSPKKQEIGGEEKPRCINAFDVAAMDGCPVTEQSDEYDNFVTKALEKNGCKLSTATYELGDVSIHYTNCFHTSGPNLASSPRMIIGVTYFADGTILRIPDGACAGDDVPSMYKKFCPGCKCGEIIATKLNPLLPHCS